MVLLLVSSFTAFVVCALVAVRYKIDDIPEQTTGSYDHLFDLTTGIDDRRINRWDDWKSNLASIEYTTGLDTVRSRGWGKGESKAITSDMTGKSLTKQKLEESLNDEHNISENGGSLGPPKSIHSSKSTSNINIKLESITNTDKPPRQQMSSSTLDEERSVVPDKDYIEMEDLQGNTSSHSSQPISGDVVIKGTGSKSSKKHAKTQDDDTSSIGSLWNTTATHAQTLWEDAKADAKEFTNATALQQDASEQIERARDAWDTTVTNVEHAEWLHNTEDWFRHAWNSTSSTTVNWLERAQDEAHALQKEDSIWWNHTVHDGKEWYNQTLYHLNKFGKTVSSWWEVARTSAMEREGVLERNFQQWWSEASDKERKWWNDTVQASHRFEQKADHKLRKWWDITSTVTSVQWNHSVETEKKWWNATQYWFHDHRAKYMTLLQDLLYFNSSQAYSMLVDGYGWYDFSYDFFQYQQGWDVQMNQAYCGVASAAAVINSYRSLWLPSFEPHDSIFDPYPYATQYGLLHNECVNDNVVRQNDFNGILQVPGGLSLEQVQRLLQCNLPPTWNVTMRILDPKTTTVFDVRRELQATLHNPSARVIVNYDRATLGQRGHGHFSPLGSYHSQRDSFLVLDVAKYKYPPVWVPTGVLVQAMMTEDNCGKWDYPQAQDEIDPALLKGSSKDHYEKALKILNCKMTYRGYIIVSMESDIL